MKKTFFVLLIVLLGMQLFSSDTSKYIVTAYKQTQLDPEVYSMSIYDTLKGSLEVLGTNKSDEEHKTSNVDITPFLSHFLYNDGDDAINDFNQHIAFAVLSYGTTPIARYSTETISITVNITSFSYTENGITYHIPVYLECGNEETIPTATNSNLTISSSLNSRNTTATNSSGASIKQTISLRNTNWRSAINASWENTIAFAIAINKANYNSAPLGEYVSNVTVTLEAN